MNAFLLACGECSLGYDGIPTGLTTDEPHLVEAMLQHGAQKNAKNGRGETPLLWSVMTRQPKTTAVLLKHAVDVNAQDNQGNAVLYWAVYAHPVNPSSWQWSQSVDIIQQLLAHGADPNLPNRAGQTPLQMAHDSNRPDLVVLLKQAGAKK